MTKRIRDAIKKIIEEKDYRINDAVIVGAARLPIGKGWRGFIPTAFEMKGEGRGAWTEDGQIEILKS